ncbi:hypothetical protein B0H16DRAFT_1738146 [Mycena metata]|uniref:Uncharacterized protein n=1 Tax=Mycena metata TaxID=1033252 RepID=A0AAD7ML34_9AGAR|nr:hypothetical protein B0H16DRAFT_1738146 [Mycena metata]
MSCGRLLTGEALKAPQDFCARFKLTRIRTLQKYFGLTIPWDSPCPSVISRVKSRCGRRIGSVTPKPALGPVDNNVVAGRSRGRDSPLPRQDLRLSSSAQSSHSSSASAQVVTRGPDLSSARGRLAAGRISRSLRPSTSTQASVFSPTKRCLTHHRSSIVLANPSVFTLIRGTVSDPLSTRCPSFTWYCPHAAPFAPAVSTPPSRIHSLHPLASGGLDGSSSSPRCPIPPL